MFVRAMVFTMSCGTLAIGCGAGAPPDPAEERREIVDNLVQAGFQVHDILVVDDAVYVGRDARVTLEASREMLEAPEGSAEQYRTTVIASTSLRKICVNPSASFNTYPKLSQGLDLAIGNYNALPLVFDFARGPTTSCSANISMTVAAGVGGSAGFPSGGLPYPGPVYIGTGLQNYSVDVSEHVITHELGHTLGVRHTDYYDRSISCGSGGNEGSAGVGAIHVPGTPTTATATGSIFNSCFTASTTGEFTQSDITMLNYLF